MHVPLKEISGKMKSRISVTLIVCALLVSAVSIATEQKPAAPPAKPAMASQKPAMPTPAVPPGAPTAPAADPAAAPSGPAAGTVADAATVAALSKPSGGPSGGLYTVKDGTKVDPKTLAGWKTWRALACERCHGAEQEGLVGPPLVESLHNLTKDQFFTTVLNGRVEKGMPPFSASKMVVDNKEGLYAYLKGRADGQIKPGHLYAMDAAK